MRTAKQKKNGKNGKVKKVESVNESYYNGLIEKFIINGVSITAIEKYKEK